MKISKSEDADSNLGQDEENSKDGSEVSGNSAQDVRPPTPVQNDEARMPDVLITPSTDVPGVISITSESSDIKLSKITKVRIFYYFPNMILLG